MLITIQNVFLFWSGFRLCLCCTNKKYSVLFTFENLVFVGLVEQMITSSNHIDNKAALIDTLTKKKSLENFSIS